MRGNVIGYIYQLNTIWYDYISLKMTVYTNTNSKLIFFNVKDIVYYIYMPIAY